MNELTEAEKAVFKAATERRRANGIRLKKISFMAESSQVEAFTTLWDCWTERYGKNRAVDVLLRLMSTIEARIREEEAQEREE